MSQIYWEPLENREDLFSSLQKLFDRSDLGFWQLPHRDDNWNHCLELNEQFAQFKKLFVIGQGGSALGGQLLVDGLGAGGKDVHFLNDFDPESLAKQLKAVDSLEDTAWLVISKSGGTLEVLALLSQVVQHFAGQSATMTDRLWVLTEPKNSPLRQWAKKNSVRLVDHPEDVGGRFAALTPVGLMPASFAGVEVEQIRQGALSALEDPRSWLDFLGSLLRLMQKGHSNTVFWAYSSRLKSFLPWLQQLWSESLGKKGVEGVSTPLISYGNRDQHSLLQQYMEGACDKSFVFIREKSIAGRGLNFESWPFEGAVSLEGKSLGQVSYAQSKGTEAALRQAGHPVQLVEVEEINAYTLGALIMAFELMVGVLGEHLGFNAFDQPGVEAGKKATLEFLNP